MSVKLIVKAVSAMFMIIMKSFFKGEIVAIFYIVLLLINNQNKLFINKLKYLARLHATVNKFNVRE